MRSAPRRQRTPRVHRASAIYISSERSAADKENRTRWRVSDARDSRHVTARAHLNFTHARRSIGHGDLGRGHGTAALGTQPFPAPAAACVEKGEIDSISRYEMSLDYFGSPPPPQAISRSALDEFKVSYPGLRAFTGFFSDGISMQ